jgi:hypothetical protein
MTEKMKAVCVGRYLVDVPVQAEITLSRERVAGFEIDTVEESEATFRDRVAAREVEIGARETGSGRTGGMVEARDLRIPDMVGRTLIYGRNRGYLMEGSHRVEDEFVSVEVYAHIAGVSFTLSAKFADEGRAKLAEALLERLRLRREGEIPAESGFCISHAVFLEPLPVSRAEHIAMHMSLPEHPDLAMAFVSMPGGASDSSLLGRVAETDSAASPDERLRVSKLRLGKRNINGLDGEEVLEQMRELNFATTYAFIWEAHGVENDPSQPLLSLELQGGISPRPGGKPVDTSLHEDAVLSLWDSIASSIRLRKNGPPPPGSTRPEPSGPKLGAVANAGEICPQSGWWRCNTGGEGMSVHGGAVQFIRQGERMPQALLLPRQTIWQKLKRIQPSVESPELTAWTLVDKRLRPRTAITVALAPAVAPAAGAAPTALEARAVPLGSHVRTGEVCLASGWWRCEESHALDGTRWFAQGSLMPVATFQVPAGVFAKSAGPEVIQRRSMWQLVRHADASVAAQSVSPTSDRLSINEPPELV